MTEITWYKRFHGTWKDPKFKAAAVIAGSTRCEALSVWDAILDESSESEERGTVIKVDRRVIAAGLDLGAELVERIWNAFVELGMLAGERIAAWVKRQGAAVERLAAAIVSTAGPAIKGRAGNAERQARFRKRRSENERQGKFSFDVTEGVTSSVTPSGEALHPPVTSATDRESDQERIPPGPPKGGRDPVPIFAKPKQVEILMPIQGGRQDGRRRETSADRAMREFKEALARAGMARDVEGDRITAGLAG